MLAAAAACLLALVAGSSGLIHGLSASAPGGGIHQGVAALATTATPTPLPTPTTVPTPTPVPTPPPFSACSTVSSANLSVPVLEYHFVRTVNGAQDPLGWSLSTTPANFAEEMALLAYDHVHVMTMSEFTSDLAAHQQPTCKSVVLTFDDGLLSMATAVAPLLYQYGFPATSFVISSFIGTAGYMSAWQILWIKSLGMTIGDHTVHHLALAKLPAAQADSEIVNAQQTIAALIQQPVVDFCYPIGSYDAQVEAQIQAAGFQEAFAEGNGATENWGNRFALSRHEVLGSWSIATWAAVVGIAPPPPGWTPPPPPYPAPPPMGS